MATEVTIPNLGYTMTVAKILRWIKSVGDTVEAGEAILEIETDKVTYAIESPAGGVVKAVLAREGEEVPVGEIVAVIGEVDEEIDVTHHGRKEQMTPPAEATQPEAPREPPPVAARPTPGDVLASPVARKMAREKGVEITRVKGSGRSGRIRMADVERYLTEAGPGKIEAAPSSGNSAIAETIPMTNMRKTIAQRLSQSSRDVPHFNLFIEVDMTEAQRVRHSLIETVEAEAGVRLSLNDVFIKVASLVLRQHPRLNARLQGDRIEILKDINMGVAVALEDGLIVPAIERADQKRLSQIAGERKNLVERAREGHLTFDELERGTFTLSNLGMYGVVSFTSILNPPQSGILSIGQTIDRPVARDGSVVIRPIVEMSLAVDHRIVDGSMGAEFLQDLKATIENPYLLF